MTNRSAESSTITREPEISARDVAAIPPDDYPAVQQALKRAAATDDQVAKNYALKRAAESIGLLSGHQPFPVEPFSDGAYPAVFLLIRESLEAGAPGVAAGIKDAMARSAALKVVARKLAPAAYGDKRQPYHSGACIGIVGMSVNLRFSDNSAEFVFHEEDLELINEEGRDLYFIRFPASEILALRQSLIDYLPASEAETRPAEVRSETVEAAARDVIAENADCRRPAVACGAGGTGTGGCGCMLAADAVLRLAAPATEAARG